MKRMIDGQQQGDRDRHAWCVQRRTGSWGARQ